ncbi:MAG: serine/threonine protein kinase [Myxococcales bacterium]|nr:serine/threonine protein kinase [Myxococcales bacterium]
MADHSKYRITDRIDSGGMAEVFRGVAESLQGFKKNIAIKRILPNLCKNKKFISMFLDEARLSLHLQHANIVGVFDIGMSPPEAGGESAYFIVMEFVDGIHLKGIIESMRRQGKRPSVAHVLYLMMEVCKGLAYAHDFADPETNKLLHIVHRDISPPNILISKMGEVKLVDFGLAKANSQLESTDPGVVKGKFSYLSPEAAQGKDVDRRADIFAVGILMYEMLTGKRLFYGENDYQTVELVRQARVPSVTQQNPEVEPELEAVVRKSLARDLNQRFQTAGELQDAIAQYLFSRGLKVTSRDISALVKNCVAERQKTQPVAKTPQSLIDELIREELLKFTSLEAGEVASEQPGSGGRPLSPEDLDGARPLDAGAFVDTRSWTDEVDATVVDPGGPFGAAAGANGVNGHLAPAQKSESARVATPIAPPSPRRSATGQHGGIEDMLEGGVLTPGRVPAVAAGIQGQGGKADKKRTGRMGIWIALVALLIVGGGTVAYLVQTGVIGH